MALTPIDADHALQIQAGILGRQTGHGFEDALTKSINEFAYPFTPLGDLPKNVSIGNPARLLVAFIANRLGIASIESASAISTGSLATSEAGKQWLSINGASVSRCKSDLVITIRATSGHEFTAGVSIKQCNNKTPTNAQLYFTTARGFVSLLQNNGIAVSQSALLGLRQFCGDAEFRPLDDVTKMAGRQVDPRRFFWEEIDSVGRDEWHQVFDMHQDHISRLLFQKAYLDDPFVPEFLLHKTKYADSWESTEVAVYSINELINLSHSYQGFATRPYSVKKGSYKDPVGVSHLAPRFGIIQMQRGGQKQHPEQLQFNLEAGYFYKLG